jgi:signal transduction histidine kinase
MATRIRPSLTDAGLAFVLAALGVAELRTSYAFEIEGPGPVALHYVTAVVVGLALAWRRLLPLVVAPAIQALFVVQVSLVAFPNEYTPIAVLVIAVFSMVVYAPTARSTVGPTLLVVAGGIVMGMQEPEDPIGTAATAVVVDALVVGAAAFVRRAKARALAAELQAAQTAAEERARIARELHDVVAHGLSVVVLQALGGRKVVTADPDAAREAFDAIERVSAESLNELRRVLGILRVPDEAPPLAPQPKLGELPDLVDLLRTSGADVELVVEGHRRSLPPAVELAAYRVAQEALTNSVKHAPGSHTVVTLGYEPDTIVVLVIDDGPGGPVATRGHGLIGMRERMNLYGGSLVAGSRNGGGFEVRATIPVSVASS